jgi:uncharacterized membrane protein YozB (DUF420 family)
MNEEPHGKNVKNLLWTMRIYLLIIIAVLVISEITTWIPADTVKFLVMLMALLTITQSFQPYLERHRNVMRWLIAGLVVALFLGVVVFFLYQ